MTARVSSAGARGALRALLGDYEREIGEAVTVGSRVAELAARQTEEWRDRSGRTRKSIRASVTRNPVGFRLTGKGKSLFLENGTSPHLITSEKGKALRFVVNGAVLFRRSVYHPGTRATYFLEHAVVEGGRTISRTLPNLLAIAAHRRGLAGA